ncbi:MAG: DNA mismatch repair endonuclease MutL [Deltaproteobacteria bacterium]|nr:DNA mismatch repair endonuclease MutL [Deltaproteobacteria bacterium]
MAHIAVLPPAIANLIAAGEVIERPSSVVKELVENAIDAEASEIWIEAEGGGLSRLCVRDDGIGMAAADAPIALKRHATSKVRSADDLASIRTLGFRGEALPSIAAIARLTLTTKARGSGVAPAVCVQTAAGAAPDCREVGAPEGTTVDVRDLFFNTPARRKFCKSERTEFAHIVEVITRFALAYPTTRFRLTHDGRSVLAAHAVTDHAARVAELFGADTAAAMCVVAEGDGPIHLAGFCGRPSLARRDTQRLYCFVNGRQVRDRTLFHAVGEGYRTYLPKGEYPFTVLFLALDPALVDVNVHPAKAEVRFADPGAVHSFVSRAVRKVLADGSSPTMGQIKTSFRGSPVTGLEPREGAPLWDHPSGGFDTGSATLLPDAPFRPLGQLAATYLLYEGPDGLLLLIDQHAAHERIGYERLRTELDRGGIVRQYMLTPATVELTALQAAAMADAQPVLQAGGLDVEPFGGNTVAVTAIPACLNDVAINELITAVADECATIGRSTAVTERIDHLLATVACHRQVRAGDRLKPAELAALVRDLGEGVSKERCPHGRPTWVAIPAREIAKWFRRS